MPNIPDDELLVQSDRQGPKVMVYVAVSWSNKTSLFFNQGRIDQVTYQQILSENDFPEIRQ